MSPFQVGVKIYDLDWYTRWDLSYERLARLLTNWGVDFVLAQSARFPMADSAVRSRAPLGQQARLAAFSERAMRDALGGAGIGYWPALCTFFEPDAVLADETLRPVGADGRPMAKEDWYLGITPTHEGWVQRQADRVAQTVGELAPDGVFLSFCRWPGFWELWMPHQGREAQPEYSYDALTLARFRIETGIEAPAVGPAEAAQWIAMHARAEWTRWKCAVIAKVVRTLGEAAHQARPGTQLMLNALPFAPDDWGNARAEVFGQDVAALAETVDAFEVMTYHQILKRRVGWIGSRGSQVKVATGRPTFCTVQARPLYLDGMHASENRHPELSADEFQRAVQSARQAGVDGVIVFTLTDLLREALGEKDMRKVAALYRTASAAATGAAPDRSHFIGRPWFMTRFRMMAEPCGRLPRILRYAARQTQCVGLKLLAG